MKEIILNIIAIIGLFLGIGITYVNTAKVYHKRAVSAGANVLMTAAWTMFIAAMWILR